MPPRRRKKPPDLPPPTSTRPHLALPLHLPPSRIHSTVYVLALHLGFSYPFCPLLNRSDASVVSDLDLTVWTLVLPVCDCSLAWRLAATPIYTGSCALDTVSDVFAFPSSDRHRSTQVKYGMVVLLCALPSTSDQVWVFLPLPCRVNLTPLTCIFSSCWCDCSLNFWRCLRVGSLLTPVPLIDRPYRGVVLNSKWLLFCCSVGLPTYNAALFLSFRAKLWWPPLDIVRPLCSVPFPFVIPVLAWGITMSSSNDSFCESDLHGTTPDPSLHPSDNPSLNPPPPLSAPSFAEALVCGLGCQNPTSPRAPGNQGRESTTSSHQPFSLSTFCLLGKPWGDPIPLHIIMSKTRKD